MIGDQGVEAELSTPTPASEALTTPEQASIKDAADRMMVFSRLKRGLTESDWKNSGARKLILDRIERTESELLELKEYRSRFHDKDKEAAVLRQEMQQLKKADKLSDFCLSAGGVWIGLCTFLFDKGLWALGLVACLIGLVLLVWSLKVKHDFQIGWNPFVASPGKKKRE